MSIEASNLLVRLASPEEDAAAIRSIYAPAVLHSAISFELEVPSVEEISNRVKRTLVTYGKDKDENHCHNTATTVKRWHISVEGLPWIVCVSKEGEVLGYAYASKHSERLAYQWSVDVSVYVKEGNRGKGIGKTLYTTLLSLLKRQGEWNRT